jgi:hypothetical protein
MHRFFREATVVMVGLLGSSGLATGASAQQAGPVRVDVQSTGGLPLVGAQVRVSPSDPLIESDESGRATITRVSSGPVWLRVRRIGYRPDSVLLNLAAGRSLDTTLIMQRVAVELAPLTVIGRRNVQGPMAGFYARQASGSGRFFSHAEIVKRAPQKFSDLMRAVPGIRIDTRGFRNNVRMRGSRCSPLVWLDGTPLFAADIDLDSFDPLSFEGVEVYNTASVPVEFTGNLQASSNCGTLVLWTRRGEASDRSKKRKQGEPSPAARIAQLLDERKVFSESDVDVAARIDSFTIVHPEYPDSLFDAQLPGRLVAEFVVGDNGVVQLDTFNPVTFTSRLLIEPVQRALRTQHFIPAVRQGRSVKQVMQLPFNFIPDSTARRKR